MPVAATPQCSSRPRSTILRVPSGRPASPCGPRRRSSGRCRSVAAARVFRLTFLPTEGIRRLAFWNNASALATSRSERLRRLSARRRPDRSERRPSPAPEPFALQRTCRPGIQLGHYDLRGRRLRMHPLPFAQQSQCPVVVPRLEQDYGPRQHPLPLWSATDRTDYPRPKWAPPSELDTVSTAHSPARPQS